MESRISTLLKFVVLSALIGCLPIELVAKPEAVNEKGNKRTALQDIIVCSFGNFEIWTDGQQIEMQWQATCFSKLEGKYIIQRTVNQEKWENIDSIQYQVDSKDQIVLYQYTDQHPLPGLSYYRIKFIDGNASVNFSNTRAVLFETDDILIYPNPANDQIQLLTGKNNSELFLELFDLNGKTILGRTTAGNDHVDIDEILCGTYILLLKKDKDGESIYRDLIIISR